MKGLFFLLIAGFVWIGCSKPDKTTTTEIPAADLIDTSQGAVKFSGNFVSAPGESVSGKALVLLKGGIYTLALESTAIVNGPDLHVYLGKDKSAVNFIDLGKLKSTNGNQVYAINGNPDFTQYKYALIYCQQYNVLFGSAELK